MNEKKDKSVINGIIEGHIKKQKSNLTGIQTVRDYLELIKEFPDLSQSAPARVFNMIKAKGVKDLSPRLKELLGDIKIYKFFENDLFGMEKSLWEIVQFFAAGAMETETGKRLLVLIGPPATGKSSLVSLIKRGLELYSEVVPIYGIKNCPIHEDPLHAVPRSLRKELENYLGVKIVGDLCPICRWRLINEYSEDGVPRWEKMPVEQIKISERARIGIGTFAPSDPKNQDISELIGRVNISKLGEYDEADPRTLSLSGELEIANRGVMEYIEVFKADPKFHQVLISVTQEGLIKAPNFPLISIDLLIVSHSNLTEFNDFIADKKNEALHDRMYVVKVPYVLRYSEEEKIYRKLISQSHLKNIHFAPHALKIAAMFAILTRLKESKICPDLLKKMKYLNGDEVIEVDGNSPDLRKMQEESKSSGEGFSGISSRFVMNAINVYTASDNQTKCINAIDILIAIKTLLKEDHHVGYSEEEKAAFEKCLYIVNEEFDNIVKKEVGLAFVTAFEEQAEKLFDNYIENITAYVFNKKMFDPVKGEEISPDENLMKSVEEYISGGVPESARKRTREQILLYKASLKQGEEFTYKTYAPLREAIEKKLIANLKDTMVLFTDESRRKDPKLAKRVSEAVESLKRKGYCDICANKIIEYASKIMRQK